MNSQLSTSPKRIAVLAPMSTLDHQPGIVNSIRCFLAAGYDVDVFAVRNRHYTPADLGSARVRYLPITINTSKDPRVFVTIAYTFWLAWALRGKYDAVFAGGIRALIAAWISSWIRPLRIINLQLELYLGPRQSKRFRRTFKWIERRAIQSAWISLIHDERRASLLANDAKIEMSSIEILPNSPIGPSNMMSSDFLKDSLGISVDSKILLAPGTIAPNFMSKEIAEIAQILPPGWCCVLHSAQPREPTEPYIQEVLAADSKNRMYLSLKPVAYEQLDHVLASGRIGLALYGDVGGENTTEVGLASGKLCEFLRLGIPVIVSSYPMLREFVHEHRVGIAISDLANIPDAINTIEADYSGYCERAASAFDRFLAFELNFEKVLGRLGNIRIE